MQFSRSFKKLILFSKISGRGGNCRVLDTTSVLTVSPTSQKENAGIDSYDISFCRKYNIDPLSLQISEHDYSTPQFLELNEVISNVVCYMAGYVVKMLQKRLSCIECKLSCTIVSTEPLNEHSPYRLIDFKNKGR